MNGTADAEKPKKKRVARYAYVCMYVCGCLYVYVSVYVCMYACMYVYYYHTYTHIHIHTYTGNDCYSKKPTKSRKYMHTYINTYTHTYIHRKRLLQQEADKVTRLYADGGEGITGNPDPEVRDLIKSIYERRDRQAQEEAAEDKPFEY